MTNTPTLPEGFIPWAGGECPVLDVPAVEIIRRNGARFTSLIPQQLNWHWRHPDFNIIAYRPDPNYVAPIDWQARALEIEEDLRQTSETLDYVRSKAEKLAVMLQNLLSVYSKPDRQMCCDGRECGCMGSTVYDEAEHYARAALAEWEGKP